jgi:hypothetical protein
MGTCMWQQERRAEGIIWGYDGLGFEWGNKDRARRPIPPFFLWINK